MVTSHEEEKPPPEAPVNRFQGLPFQVLLRFMLGTLALGLWAALLLVGCLLWTLGGQDEAQATAAVRIARARLAMAVEREVGLVRTMADDPSLKIWAEDETSVPAKFAAFANLEPTRKVLLSTEGFVALEGSHHLYFLDGKPDSADFPPDYTVRKTEKNDEWFFSPNLDKKDFVLKVEPDRELGTTRIMINAAIRGRDRKLGVAGSSLNLEAILEAGFGRDAKDDQILILSPSGEVQLNPKRQHPFLNAKAGRPSRPVAFQSLIPEVKVRAQAEAALKSLQEHPDQVETFRVPFENATAQAGLIYLQDMDCVLVVLCHPASRLLPLSIALGTLTLGWLLLSWLVASRLLALISPPAEVTPPKET